MHEGSTLQAGLSSPGWGPACFTAGLTAAACNNPCQYAAHRVLTESCSIPPGGQLCPSSAAEGSQSSSAGETSACCWGPLSFIGHAMLQPFPRGEQREVAISRGKDSSRSFFLPSGFFLTYSLVFSCQMRTRVPHCPPWHLWGAKASEWWGLLQTLWLFFSSSCITTRTYMFFIKME